MVWVTYHCPYCGAVTGVERDAYMNDKCVTREPLDGWTYADATDDVEAADGVRFVCLGDGARDSDGDATGASADRRPAGEGGANDPRPGEDGCGRTFYLNYVKYADGVEVDHRTPDIDRPRFDFSP
ncbi:hypothetical protein [Halorubellus sp. PRR65]|uniref:hypothetical protein n=1 Tax=Halorubellus sp. PRR65 TaxID=3098148 RepID=UPI002B25D937|nr:hypothetical protein [Halorubellus sp. PRR65]